MRTLTNDLAIVSRIPAVQTILDVVCKTTGMGFAAVARVTEDHWVACSVLDHINFGLKPGGELEVETTICHEIRQMRKAVVIDHVFEDEDFRDHPTPRRYGFQSYISVPIMLPGGTFFGTLCAIDPRPARLKKPEVVGMFELFADLVAFHISATEKLESSESRLFEERQVSELREQFIGVLGHDLRNPLGAINMGAAMLGRSKLTDDQSRTVEMIQRSVTGMAELINHAMDFTRGRLGGGIPLDLCAGARLEPVLRQVIDEVQRNWPIRAIETHFTLDEGVDCDRARIAQLFTNLLSNAMTHGKPDKPVVVRASSEGRTFELSVTNAAAPIPPEKLERLFEPFSRGGSEKYEQGLGLGLYIVSEIAKAHGGSIEVASTNDEVRFIFRLIRERGKL